MKKIVGILVMTLFLVSVYGSATKIDLNDDIIDQSQPFMDLNNKLIPGHQNAQSFRPSLNNLSKVELYLYRIGNPQIKNIIFSIKDSQSEANLTTVEKSVGEISTGWNWIELDFDDLVVQPGKTYYIVCNPIGDWNDDYDNSIWWGACLGNQYLAGSPWDIYSGIWKTIGHDVYEIDYCFQTYGFNNYPPNKPTINGNISGIPGTEYQYTFMSTDPESDNISYYTDWGDNTTSGWLGSYSSGVNITVNHTWNATGTYSVRIMARDFYGHESDWATLEVTMPKTHIHNPIMQLLMKMLYRFPLFEKILNQYYYN